MSAAILWRAITRPFVPAICVLLTACGSGDGFVGAGGASGPLTANFDSIQANIFEPLCEHCHSGATAPVGLRLDAANSYALLVGVASGERPNLLRVAPGDPNNSYIIQKLEGTAGIGERMPAGLPAVPQADINVIRQWITDGAQPSSPAAGPIRVTSLSPAPNSTVSALPASITVGFNREFNAPSVTTATFTLRRAGRGRRARHGRRRRDHAGVGDRTRGEPALGRHELDRRRVGVRPLSHHARRHGRRRDPRPGRQRARRRAPPAAVRRRHRGRRLHGDVHGRRHAVDADVDPDERVHAALLGLPHGRRRAHYPGA